MIFVYAYWPDWHHQTIINQADSLKNDSITLTWMDTHLQRIGTDLSILQWAKIKNK